MLTWTQQFNTITKIFHSFSSGKKIVNIRISDQELERSQYILRPSKYESFTKGNFIIVVLHTMFYNKLPSKIELLKLLNELNKDDVNKTFHLKSDIQSYWYLMNQDAGVMKELSISPYEAYKLKKISAFSVAEYYSNNPDKIRGRIMKKEVTDTQVLVQHFNIKEQA